MRPQTLFFLVWGIIWRLAAIAFAFYFTWRVRFIVVIILLSIIITFIVNPLVDRICHWQPRFVTRPSWRFIVTLTTFLTLGVVSVSLLLWLWSPFQTQLNQLQLSMGDYQKILEKHLAGLRDWYRSLPASVRDALAGQPVDGITQYVFGIIHNIIQSTINWARHIWELVLVPVLAFYFCLDSRSLKRELLFLVPYQRVRETIYILRHTAHIMEKYVVAQLVLCIVAGVAVGFGLWMLDMPYALVLGVLAGITRAVPIVGPIVSAIPITLVAMAVSIETGLSVLIFFCCLHLFESKVLLPQLIGHSMKLHPAIILIVLLIGGEFFGILGMFLAAPVTAILRLLLNFYVVEPEARRRKANAVGELEEAAYHDEEDVLPKVP